MIEDYENEMMVHTLTRANRIFRMLVGIFATALTVSIVVGAILAVKLEQAHTKAMQSIPIEAAWGLFEQLHENP